MIRCCQNCLIHEKFSIKDSKFYDSFFDFLMIYYSLLSSQCLKTQSNPNTITELTSAERNNWNLKIQYMMTYSPMPGYRLYDFRYSQFFIDLCFLR